MDSATIRYQGTKKILGMLDKLASPEQRKQLLDDIGAYGVSSSQQRFLDQAGPDGAKWKKSRRAVTTGGQTLRKTTRLFTSLVSHATASAVEWGTNVIYAGIHQFGGVIKAKDGGKLAFKGGNGNMVFVDKVTMPARPYLGISALDHKRIEQIAGGFFERMAQ